MRGLKEYGSRVTAACLSPPFRISQTTYCYAGATYPCRATLGHVIPSSTCEFRCFTQFILADAVYSHQASELRNTVMLRLRRVADMCSSKVSDTANRRIHDAQSASMRKKKSSAVPCFAAVAVLRFSPCPPKGNGSQEGRNRRCLPSCPLGVGTPPPADSEMFRN